MKLFYGITLLIGVLACCNAAAAPVSKPIASNEILLRSVMESASSTTFFYECFSLYAPILDQIAIQFNESFIACETEALSQTDKINGWAAGNETLLKDKSQAVCNSLNQCSSAPDGDFSIFDCYSNTGKTNSRNSYNLSAEAEIIGAELRNEVRIVSDNQLACENQCERARTQEQFSATMALKDCLSNGPPEIITASVLDTNKEEDFKSPDGSSGLEVLDAKDSKTMTRQILKTLKRSIGGS